MIMTSAGTAASLQIAPDGAGRSPGIGTASALSDARIKE
jgi:hypothetical protein